MKTHFIPTFATAILFLFFTSFSASAQLCPGSGIDQSLTSSASGTTDLQLNQDQPVYQTFIPTQPLLGGASVVIPAGWPMGTGTSTLTIELVSGVPMTGPPPPALATGNVVINGPVGSPTLATVVWTPTAVTPGNTYHLRMVTSDFNLAIINSNADEYANGDAYFDPPIVPLFFDLFFEVYFCPPPPPVPTLSQWGIILLILLLMTFGTVKVMHSQLVLAGESTKGAGLQLPYIGSLPFEGMKYTKTLMAAALFVVAVFTIAIFAFGYSLTSSDIPGALICTPVLGYLIYLMMHYKKPY